MSTCFVLLVIFAIYSHAGDIGIVLREHPVYLLTLFFFFSLKAFTLNPLDPGYHYIGPTNETNTQNPCTFKVVISVLSNLVLIQNSTSPNPLFRCRHLFDACLHARVSLRCMPEQDVYLLDIVVDVLPCSANFASGNVFTDHTGWHASSTLGLSETE